MIKFFVFTLGITLFSAGSSKKNNNPNIVRAETTLTRIFQLYNSGFDHLLNETFPYREDNKVTYLAGADTLQGKRVAYLWPASGVFSGVNALFASTGNPKYTEMLKSMFYRVFSIISIPPENRLPTSRTLQKRAKATVFMMIMFGWHSIFVNRINLPVKNHFCRNR